jgi:hypothetical protein
LEGSGLSPLLHHESSALPLTRSQWGERYLEILLTSNRIPEAAFFAGTYLPIEISRVAEEWRVQLGKVTEKAGQSLFDLKVGI